jgi:hypothetical protein
MLFRWRPEYEWAGFAQNALYLVRPDTYVALAHGSGAVDALRRYFERRGIHTEAYGSTRKEIGPILNEPT